MTTIATECLAEMVYVCNLTVFDHAFLTAFNCSSDCMLLEWMKQQRKPTCLFQDLLDNAKEHNLRLLASCDHVTVGGLLMQAGREAGAVPKAVALRNALLEVQGVLGEELQQQE